MVRRLGLGKNNHLTYASLALNPRSVVLLVTSCHVTHSRCYWFQVPFGKLAFMPGQLVHTNEILVLLGDNWFAERSAAQAAEIIDRRMKSKINEWCQNG